MISQKKSQRICLWLKLLLTRLSTAWRRWKESFMIAYSFLLILISVTASTLSSSYPTTELAYLTSLASLLAPAVSIPPPYFQHNTAKKIMLEHYRLGKPPKQPSTHIKLAEPLQKNKTILLCPFWKRASVLSGQSRLLGLQQQKIVAKKTKLTH